MYSGISAVIALVFLSNSVYSFSLAFLDSYEDTNPVAPEFRTTLWESCLPVARIVGGQPAHITEAPYQVGIRLIRLPGHSPWRSSLVCGGSVIAPRLVLTAAHCFVRYRDPQLFKVTLGSTYRLVKTVGAEVRSIEKLILHPKFRLTPIILFDIALMVLDRRVEESRFIKFLELASKPAQENMSCMITGWGREDFWQPTKPRCMQKAYVPILNLTECRIRATLPIYDGFLCAGYYTGGVDSCSGDSGGPLVCDGVQYGIVSYGKDCAAVNNPGIYTDVYQNLEWIKKESVNWGRRWTPSLVLVLTNFIFIQLWH
ncbi:trypsin 3A1 [Aedes albopictus]|uniref:Peptidase S1 domain-containing protein n=1 Tax=Aedes albopictus TaxID=7160 RepID=A0ABM1Z7Y7_AEDAL